MSASDQAIRQLIRDVRTIASRIGVGEFDDADPTLLRQLVDLADWLKDATEITLKVNE